MVQGSWSKWYRQFKSKRYHFYNFMSAPNQLKNSVVSRVTIYPKHLNSSGKFSLYIERKWSPLTNFCENIFHPILCCYFPFIKLWGNACTMKATTRQMDRLTGQTNRQVKNIVPNALMTLRYAKGKKLSPY